MAAITGPSITGPVSVAAPAAQREETVQGHYIDIRGLGADVDVLGVVIEVLAPVAVRGGVRGCPLLRLPGGAEVFVDEVDEHLTVLAIDDPSPSAAGRHAAAGVYERLVAATGWELWWSSDVEPTVIAMRRGVRAAATPAPIPPLARVAG